MNLMQKQIKDVSLCGPSLSIGCCCGNSKGWTSSALYESFLLTKSAFLCIFSKTPVLCTTTTTASLWGFSPPSPTWVHYVHLRLRWLACSSNWRRNTSLLCFCTVSNFHQTTMITMQQHLLPQNLERNAGEQHSHHMIATLVLPSPTTQ